MSIKREFKVKIKNGQTVGVLAKDVNDAISMCAAMYKLPAGSFKVVE